jgi:hypothetical protein
MEKQPNFATIIAHPEKGELKILRSYAVGDYSSYQLEETIKGRIIPTWYPKDKLTFTYKLILCEGPKELA